MTYVGHDPLQLAADVAQLDGLAALRALIASEMPPAPIAVLLGFEPALATAEARVTAGDRLLAHGTAGVLILPPAARTASTAPPASVS